MELAKVRLEDVYPDENNPREDFGDIAALAATFSLNSERPGEPFAPPIVVRDGGIYRIVDGERRYRAMESLGVAEFTANVCDDVDEAEAAVAMLATDDKKALTDIERSRGTQKMLMLGVDPVRVEKASRLEGGQAAKIAATMATVDDAAEDMTLDRMLAIYEFIDEPEVVAALEGCREDEWRFKADQARRDRKAREGVAAMMAKAGELGIVLADDRDAEAREGYRYAGMNPRTPEDLERLHAEHPEAIFTYTRTGYFYGYVPAEREDADPGEAERAKRADELAAAFNATVEAIGAWFRAKMQGGLRGVPDGMKRLCFDAFKDGTGFDDAFEEDYPMSDAWLPSLWDLALGYGYAEPDEWRQAKAAAVLDLDHGGFRVQDLPAVADFLETAAADGFEFEGEHARALGAVRAWMEAGAGEGE